MSDISNLPLFPHTIGNLDDRPNLPADEMKAKFEQDCMELWNKVREVIPDLNARLPLTDLVKVVNSSSTDGKVPTAKAVYSAIADALLGAGGTIANTIITAWLNDHPEATTTVLDGSITDAKLASSGIKVNAVQNQGFITATGDADDYKTQGTYFNPITDGVTKLTNIPVQAAGFLIVLPADATSANTLVFQFYFRSPSGEAWLRRYNQADSTWSTWAEIGFHAKTLITTDTSADDILENGFYYNSYLGSNVTRISNVPETWTSGTLIVVRGTPTATTSVTQYYIPTRTAKLYARTLLSGTFTPWKTLENPNLNCVDVDQAGTYNSSPYTDKNATFVYDDAAGTITISTSDAVGPTQALFRLIYRASSLPTNWVPGGYIYIKGETPADSGISFAITFLNGDEPAPTDADHRHVFSGSFNSKIKIPSDAIGVLWACRVATGTELEESITISRPTITSAYSNADLSEIVTESNMKRKVRMLVIGNSSSYGDYGYFPQIMADIAPEIDLDFAYLYEPSIGVAGHITMLDNNDAYSVYNEWDSSTNTWANTSGTVTAKDALTSKEWDYIAVQPSMRILADYDYLETYIDKVLSVIDYPTSFLLSFPQCKAATSDFSNCSPSYSDLPTGEAKAAAQYAANVARAREAVENGRFEAMLPFGTSIQNARTNATFQETGTNGYLTVDDGGHLQTGIALLIAGYAGAMELCHLLGVPGKVLNCRVAGTEAFTQASNLYTRNNHGPAVGASTDNKHLAQKIAIAAFKNPYEVTDFSGE